ncbi:Protein TAR1 [Capsicum baccatum]|uniref:Protein TAR1 n=1 Tax=Capsicum baccatum TaxID=33114 RepID=A0A2G2V1U0_CAPBA|nr:Protein TAR1 [Capsicum baccatum]
MSTTGCGRHSVLRIFKGRWACTGHHAMCGALPAAGPYLRLSRFQGVHAVKQKRLLGSCFKTGRMGSPQASVQSAQMPKHAGGTRCLPQSRRQHSTSVSRARALAPPIHAGPRPGSIGVPARRRSTDDRGALPDPIRFPPDNFKHSLTLFSKSFSSFPRGSCSLMVSRPYLSLDGIHRPIWAAFPNNPTRRQRLVVRQGPGTTGLSPSPVPPSRGLGPGPPLRTLLQTTIRTTEPPDSKAGLFPIRSPLLRESL